MFYISVPNFSNMFKQLLLAINFLFLIINATAQPKDSTVDANSFFKPVKWRSIGPFRGGRSNCGTGVPGDINTYYMGTTGGGLWKTDDLGLNWTNISDGYFKTGSVGAIAVPESDANVVYVGMGEHAIRGVMTHHGDGVYKSTDAGKTWKHMGLEATQHIARIAVHPKDPNTLLVAAQGALYSKSKERGIYKSTDGGITWKNVLFVNENTGCNELSMDMNNPRIIYASMWEHGRKPWQVISGGAGSGLYKSVDGGDTWQKLTNGLPAEMGKMSIAVSRSNPEKVYALIESDSEKEAGGLFVSNNAGANWSRITNDHRLIQRAWYYIELFIDPNNDQTIYVLSAPALRSRDGGRTWENLGGTHGDYHDLWINPRNSNNMIISNDGGCAVSVNFARTWSPQSNMPTAQIYRINVDNQFPYHIYGGQQDNTSVSIAHRSFGGGAITTSEWTASAGGESAFLAFDPNDPRYVLGGSYQGTIEVLDTKAKGSTNIMPAPIQYLGKDAKDIKYRYNWNAPIIWSKHEPNTYYHGAQLLLKTTDMGRTWKEVSPDLTRNEKEKQGKGGVPYTNEAVGAENYGTLAYVNESPHEKGVLYTGSDDGYVHVTKDGGASWTNITPTGLQECLINAIEVSPHDKGTVYIATTRYKFNDHTPGLYKSTDYGKTWTKINNGIPNNAFTRVVREDEVRKDLLFAGTEIGLFVSFDGGKQWQNFQLNLPVTPLTDLRVHKGDLIAATSGRSFWILDDLNVLRQYKKEQSGVLLYQPEDAYIANGFSAMNATNPTGTNRSFGVNPANGVVLYYTLPELKAADTVTITITDANGKLIRRFSSVPDNALFYDGAPPGNPTISKQKGLNRFVWDMRTATMPGIPNVYIESSYAGHKAIPGTYTVTLKAGTQQANTTAVIAPNPLYNTTPADYAAYDAFMSAMETEVTVMHNLVNKLNGKRLQLEDLIKNLTDAKYEPLHKEAQALAKDMKAWDEEMVQRKSKAYDDVENFPNKFTANYLFLVNQTESDLPRVNQPNIDLKKEYDAQWLVLKQKADALEARLNSLNKKLGEAGVGAVWK
jgi:photosystem II stability/assembly factor-like uncharacterized protein